VFWDAFKPDAAACFGVEDVVKYSSQIISKLYKNKTPRYFKTRRFVL